MFFDGSLDGIKTNKRKLYAIFEILYTMVDFFAAVSFTIGSIMFLYPKLMHSATWFFIVGSLLFTLKPTIRVVREIKLATKNRKNKLHKGPDSGLY